MTKINDKIQKEYNPLYETFRKIPNRDGVIATLSFLRKITELGGANSIPLEYIKNLEALETLTEKEKLNFLRGQND